MAVLSNFVREQANLHDSQRQFDRLIPQMDSLLKISLNDPEWEKIEAPKGAYTSTLRQQEITCYQCNQKGHIKKSCPSKKKSGKNKKSNGGKTNGNSNSQKKTDDGDLKKMWYNENKDNKTTMEHDGVSHFWCPTFNWGRGRWVDHKPEECRWKRGNSKSSESTSTNKEGGFLLMDLVDSGFMAIEIL